jgi:3-keto-disaccharide hydrolase
MRYFCAAVLLSTTLGCAQNSGPQPEVVDPGGSGKAPSDAIVLFDGKDLSEWVHSDGQPARWFVRDGAVICKTGTGDIRTKRKFGSAQIHVEFATPNMPEQHGQFRGNSGIYIQGRYEVQVLDSYQNPTYANGSCGALYGQYSPLVNACRPPAQWQTYDMIFHVPKCGSDGKVSQHGSLTLLQNGILVLDHVSIAEPTGGADPTSVCDPGPLRLQDHVDPHVRETPIRFRNMWYRPLE